LACRCLGKGERCEVPGASGRDLTMILTRKRVVLIAIPLMLVIAWVSIATRTALQASRTRAIVESHDFTKASAGVAGLGGPERALPLLTEYIDLPDDDAPLKERAIVMLGACGTPAVPVLVRLLDDPKYARHSALALSIVGPSAIEALPSLIKVLASDDDSLRRRAVAALAAIGPAAKDAVPNLEPLLEDRDPCVAVFAAGAIWGITHDPEKPLATLLKVLKDEQDPSDAKPFAVFFLGTMGSEARSAAGEIEKALTSKDPMLRGAAEYALDSIRGLDHGSANPVMMPPVKTK